MELFNYVVEECQLRDLCYKGAKQAWRNNRESSNFILERLDRALATEGWCIAFLNAIIEVLPNINFDHNPLWVRFKSNLNPNRR